jgi:hypothetical protein
LAIKDIERDEIEFICKVSPFENETSWEFLNAFKFERPV